ncbi:MAG TPA: TRAP transporter TatT component family protein [Polyangiales bacterium]|nr:TRAP transporter TatT component family protein [Polyangiales bacterium]
MERYVRASALWLALCTTLTTGGCKLEKIAADSTVKVAEAGALGFNGFWDYEIFGQAVPGAILQSEALVRISPNNENLLTGLAKTYVVYAYGWLSAEWEDADQRGDFEAADELEKRIRLLYERSSHLALRVVHRHDREGRLEQVLATKKVDELKAYLTRVYKDKDDVPGLYWAGLAWGSMMANSGGDLNVLADAPLARAMLERSVELEPGFADAGALGVLGTVEGAFPEIFGGDLGRSKAYYDRALEVCKRRNQLILLSYAKTYAVGKQDRELFVALLTEILTAPDQGDDIRMNNKVAQVRAKRYLKRVDEWFPPPLPSDEAASAPSAKK